MMSEHAPPRATRLFSTLALAIVATLGLLYIVSQFLRNSVGVIAPDLAAELGLSPMQIGLLSSIYFFVFAATQLPLGVAFDRFGPKMCMLVSIAFTVAGCVLFALAPGAGGLVAGRALLGFGTASFLMAPVALYARWFPPDAVFHARRHPYRHRLDRHAVCDRAARLRRRELRMARGVPRRRRDHRRDRRS